jgi:hypothetical protein
MAALGQDKTESKAVPNAVSKTAPRAVAKVVPITVPQNRSNADSLALSSGVDATRVLGVKRKFDGDGDSRNNRGGHVSGSSDKSATRLTDNGRAAVKFDPDSKSEDAGTVHAIVVPKHRIIRFLNGNVQATLTILATQSKRLRRIPPEDGNEENKRRYRDVRAYLDWMATNRTCISLDNFSPLRLPVGFLAL